VRSYYVFLIMQVKETPVAKGMSPFIIKVGASSIPSPITKARVSFYHESGCVSHSVYRERQVLEWCIFVSYPLIKRLPR
jgi:hypothetical protein